MEQSDPDRFYGELAEDSAKQVNSWHPLRGSRMLDVGGGPGFFATAFEARGATYVAVDADAGEMRLHGRAPGPRTVLASGEALPFEDGSFDVTYSSNVLEHVADPWRMTSEMLRVTRVGGTVICSYTLWWGPWGGHETAPWHYIGGYYAAARYQRRHGRPPKNVFGTSLFKTTVGAGIRWALAQPDVEVLGIVPRYLPRGTRWVVRVPGLRELLCWNVVLILRRRPVPLVS